MHTTSETEETHHSPMDWRLLTWMACCLWVVAIGFIFAPSAAGLEAIGTRLVGVAAAGLGTLCWDRGRRAVRVQRGESA